MQIKTIGDLRRAIQELPDDFRIMAEENYSAITLASKYKRRKWAKKLGRKTPIKRLLVDF